MSANRDEQQFNVVGRHEVAALERRAELVDRAPSTGGAPVLATPNGAAASELAAELSVAAIAAPTPSSEPMSSLVADQEAFLRMADYVSPDGRQLRHGDVAISTTGPVSRQHP